MPERFVLIHSLFFLVRTVCQPRARLQSSVAVWLVNRCHPEPTWLDAPLGAVVGCWIRAGDIWSFGFLPSHWFDYRRSPVVLRTTVSFDGMWCMQLSAFVTFVYSGEWRLRQVCMASAPMNSSVVPRCPEIHKFKKNLHLFQISCD